MLTEQLHNAIKNKDKELTLSLLNEMTTSLRDEALVNAIVSPVFLKETHGLLVEHFGVNPRAMMLKHRVSLRNQRAFMFIKAMINGMNRI